MAQQAQLTPQQAYTNRVYDALLQTHGIRLSREQYSFHLNSFRLILERDDATHSEAIAAGERIVARLPHYPKMDAAQALQDIRRRAAATGAKAGANTANTEPMMADHGEPVDRNVLRRAARRAFEDYSDAELERRVDEADQGDEWAQLELDRRREEAGRG